MVRDINGFKLEVKERDGLPHVRVSFADGRVVVDTDQVSITGMRNLGAVLAVAAKLAYAELDCYYAREHERMRQELRART